MKKIKIKRLENKCFRKRGVFHIEIPEEIIISAAQSRPQFPVEITDKNKLIDYIVDNIFDYGEEEYDVPASFFKVLDGIISQAAELNEGCKPMKVD